MFVPIQAAINMFVYCRPSISNQLLLLLLYYYCSFCMISILGVVKVIQAEIATPPLEASNFSTTYFGRNSFMNQHYHNPLQLQDQQHLINKVHHLKSKHWHHQSKSVLSTGYRKPECSHRRYETLTQTFDDIEDLDLNVSANIAFEHRQKKRFVLQLNSSTPLTITFSKSLTRKIYFNQTSNILDALRWDTKMIHLPCALSGQYDVFVQARQRYPVKIEATIERDLATNLPFLAKNHKGAIQTQNQVKRRQMKVQWSKSKFDSYAMRYCLVVSTKRPHYDFCEAVQELASSLRPEDTKCKYIMEYLWQKPVEMVKKIDHRDTNIFCLGSRTKQNLRNLVENETYFLDVFGIHTRRQNASFHLASKKVIFNPTSPFALKDNQIVFEKISGMQGNKVFSFKIPKLYSFDSPGQARFLILPCKGSEINIYISRRKNSWHPAKNVFSPYYIRLTDVKPNERYMFRFNPSNTDEILRAKKVGIAVTTSTYFPSLAELPRNTTVYEVRNHCTSTTIAWASSPDPRPMSYCIIALNLPQRRRSYTDNTNYCMDFDLAHLKENPQLHAIRCIAKTQEPPELEKWTVENLLEGESYLIYVTANLSDGRPVPYESLQVTMPKFCPYD